MTPEQLIERVRQRKPLSFNESMAVIDQYYHHQPTAFRNGQGEERVVNSAEQNQGSCKLLGFGQLQGLDVEETLHLFGDFYYQEVLNDPQGSAHANIRAFGRHGWAGVDFDRPPLNAKSNL